MHKSHFNYLYNRMFRWRSSGISESQSLNNKYTRNLHYAPRNARRQIPLSDTIYLPLKFRGWFRTRSQVQRNDHAHNHGTGPGQSCSRSHSNHGAEPPTIVRAAVPTIYEVPVCRVCPCIYTCTSVRVRVQVFFASLHRWAGSKVSTRLLCRSHVRVLRAVRQKLKSSAHFRFDPFIFARLLAREADINLFSTAFPVAGIRALPLNPFRSYVSWNERAVTRESFAASRSNRNLWE